MKTNLFRALLLTIVALPLGSAFADNTQPKSCSCKHGDEKCAETKDCKCDKGNCECTSCKHKEKHDDVHKHEKESAPKK